MRLIHLHTTFLFIAGLLASSCSSPGHLTAEKENAAAVLSTIHAVNRYWQSNNPEHGRAFWDNAAYHTGNMEVVKLTGDETYRQYSEAWAVKSGRNDYWWWADGLYMVMPVMVKMYKITGDPVYLDKLYSWFTYANSIMYDSTEHIYFRDARYVYPRHSTATGKKDFWARGNGWVFAGLAKVLQDLPVTDPHREEYMQTFRQMAETLKQYQQPEGYWTRSIMDMNQAPGYETSGTAFFTYGYFWGINNGYLDRSAFLPVAQKGWNFLRKVALQPDGKIGYVQPIGERAIPGQVVDKDSTSNFGVGAFLLAACERYRFLERK